jgi:hypothetical protein
MNKKFVPIELIKYQLGKIRKSSNFNYRKAIERNRRNQVKHPPLIDLLNYLHNRNVPDAKIDEIVREYWEAVEKNNNFEKEIANEINCKEPQVFLGKLTTISRIIFHRIRGFFIPFYPLSSSFFSF